MRRDGEKGRRLRLSSMAIYNLFSKRQKAASAKKPDAPMYDALPHAFRVQVVHIWFATLGNPNEYGGYNNQVGQTYDLIVKTLCREYGVFRLPYVDERFEETTLQMLVSFFGRTPDVDHALDAIELTFRAVDRLTRSYQYLQRTEGAELADQATSELNQRFQEHNIGYRYTDGRIIRIDSEVIHTEIVTPALNLLTSRHYAGAQQEYLKAHEHYRKGDGKEAMTECAKALESTMKSICDRRRWTYDKNATAKQLIKVCFDNGLIPQFWETHFSHLRSSLEVSVPVGRNKVSAHGQGATVTEVPNYLVAYMLHMTASTIVFLAEAEAVLP